MTVSHGYFVKYFMDLPNQFLYFQARPLCVKGDASRFMISMSNRQSYMSTVAAMLTLSDTADKKRDLLHGFCRSLDDAAAKAKILEQKQKQLEITQKIHFVSTTTKL